MKILKLFTRKRITGNRGEDIAQKFLKKHGYKILERNYVANSYEIDIIAENRDTLVFVEVKTRTDGQSNPKEPRPASSVTSEKQRKIINSARSYIPFAQNKRYIRFDIIEVILSADGKPVSITHIESAFNSNTAFDRCHYHKNK